MEDPKTRIQSVLDLCRKWLVKYQNNIYDNTEQIENDCDQLRHENERKKTFAECKTERDNDFQLVESEVAEIVKHDILQNATNIYQTQCNVRALSALHAEVWNIANSLRDISKKEEEFIPVSSAIGNLSRHISRQHTNLIDCLPMGEKKCEETSSTDEVPTGLKEALKPLLPAKIIEGIINRWGREKALLCYFEGYEVAAELRDVTKTDLYKILKDYGVLQCSVNTMKYHINKGLIVRHTKFD